MKLSASQRGHIHLVLIAIVVVTFVAGVGLSVYSARQGDSTATNLVELDETATTATSKLDKEAKKKAKLKKKGRGAIQVTTKELVVTKSGKRVIKKRGNVLIRVTTTNPKAACRDGGELFKQQAGGMVFQHKSDDKKGGNKGKLKIDSCSIGTYRLKPVISSQYEVLESPVKFNVNPKKTTKLTVTIARKGDLATTAPVKGPGGSKKPGAPGPNNPEFDDDDSAPEPGPAAAGEVEKCKAIMQQYNEGQEIPEDALDTCEQVVPCEQVPYFTPEDCQADAEPGLLPEDAQYE